MEQNKEKTCSEIIVKQQMSTLPNGKTLKCPIECIWKLPLATLLSCNLCYPLRQDVLQQLHNSRMSSHLVKTFGQVYEKFYWVQRRQYVQQWCWDFDLCGQKRDPQKIRASLKRFNECIAIDELGPLPTTELGNKYILIINFYKGWSLPSAKPRGQNGNWHEQSI